MRQLTGLDTMFLNMETPTTFGHVAGLIIFDPKRLRGKNLYEALRELFAERIHLVPPLRWKLVEVPLGLDFPYWVEETECDLDFHLRHIAVPAPGSREQLSTLICRLHARPLDRTRPLWEAYIIEGLDDGNVAYYWKQHHAAIDGVSGTNMNSVLFDLTPDGRTITPEEPRTAETVPTQLELLTRGASALSGKPVQAAQWLYRVARAMPLGDMLPSVSDLRRKVLGPREGELLEPIEEARAPRLPFNHSISSQRCFAYGNLPLADVKFVKNTFGTTLNDVVMAISSAALRRWLIDHDALPKDPTYASVPISVRPAGKAEEYGNQVSNMISELGTHIDDPVERLQFCAEQMRDAKEKHGAMPATELMDAANLIPPALAVLGVRAAFQTRLTDYVDLPFNIVISNVPGPREPIYAAGAEMIGWYPVSALGDGMGLNVTVLSYRDSLGFGLLACPKLVPDVENLGRYFEEALAELKTAADAKGKPKSKGKR